MIKILISDKQKQKIIEKHIEKLSKKKGILEKIKQKLNENRKLKVNFLEKIKKLDDSLLKENLIYDLEHLDENVTNLNYKGLKSFFTAEKEELDMIKKAFGEDQKFIDLKKSKQLKGDKKYYYEFYNLFLSGYSDFRSKWSDWNGLKYAQLLGLRTCPYCNMSYIYIYSSNSKTKTTAELDHYYSKDKYPYLALSIFNLIPCCHNCNHIKSNKEKEILYPFNNGFEGHAKFEIEKTKLFLKDLLQFSTSQDNIKINIVYDSNNQKEIKKSIECFCLKERYNNHNIEASEIIMKTKIFPKEKIQEYSQLLSIDEQTLKSLIYDTRLKKDEYKNKILSKFTNDILDEFTT